MRGPGVIAASRVSKAPGSAPRDEPGRKGQQASLGPCPERRRGERRGRGRRTSSQGPGTPAEPSTGASWRRGVLRIVATSGRVDPAWNKVCQFSRIKRGVFFRSMTRGSLARARPGFFLRAGRCVVERRSRLLARKKVFSASGYDNYSLLADFQHDNRDPRGIHAQDSSIDAPSADRREQVAGAMDPYRSSSTDCRRSWARPGGTGRSGAPKAEPPRGGGRASARRHRVAKASRPRRRLLQAGAGTSTQGLEVDEAPVWSRSSGSPTARRWCARKQARAQAEGGDTAAPAASRRRRRRAGAAAPPRPPRPPRRQAAKSRSEGRR
jgi:hypothetical protein